LPLTALESTLTSKIVGKTGLTLAESTLMKNPQGRGAADVPQCAIILKPTLLPTWNLSEV
jgi:hypothetical protein